MKIEENPTSDLQVYHYYNQLYINCNWSKNMRENNEENCPTVKLIGVLEIKTRMPGNYEHFLSVTRKFFPRGFH